MKIIAISAILLSLSSGVALADRHRGSWDHGRSAGWAWNGNAHVRAKPHHWRNLAYIAPRRPIYVRVPVVRERHFDVRYRPRVIVENYAPVAGYQWVGGRWDWDGAEWIWTPGYYDPVSAYGELGYLSGDQLNYTSYPPSHSDCDHDNAYDQY